MSDKKKSKNSIKRLKLKNGLSVLMIENHKSPVVSVQMWVKTGSADEIKGEEGISHFIEHLVFKGTKKYGVGEIASLVEASGGELNAYTSFDQTVFYVNISKEFGDVALDVIGEMVGYPQFDSQEIDNEREVVLEEIKRSNDSLGRQASRLLFSTVFKNHPYGIPVIGYDKIIKKVSRKTLVNYYQSRYVPRNMHLVVAGDFDTREMTKKCQTIFGAIESFPLRRVARKKEPKQTTNRINVKKAPFEEAQFHIAWPIPGAHHKDIAALDVLALILGQGDSSRLSSELRIKRPLTNSIGAGTFTPKDNGIFTISGSINPDNTQEVFEGIRGELEKLLKEAPVAEELRKAITNLESEEFYAMETIEGIARKAGSFENLMGDYAYFQKFLKQIYGLKPDDLLKVARKYLLPSNMNVVMLTPRGEKETKKFLNGWKTKYKKSYDLGKKSKSAKAQTFRVTKTKWTMGGAGAKETDGKLIRHQLANGVNLIFRTSSETPVFSAKAAFRGGIRAELPNKEGTTELLSRVWTSGTAELTETEILRQIENIAGGLSAFGGKNSVGVSAQAISPFEEEAVELFSEILTAPSISQEAVEREKVVMLEVLKSREDSPAQLVSQMFSQSMFANHPYARDIYGTNDSVRSLTKSDVEKHLEKMASSSNLTLAITGQVDVDYWIQSLESTTARLHRGQKMEDRFEHLGPQKTERHFKKTEREQTHIIIGYKGLTLSDPRRYTLQVIQSILAGQGGRLFLELRDKASLAYSVSPIRMEGIDTGYFGAYIGCSPAKGAKAIEMLQEEFRKLVESPVSADELDRAKRYLIGRHDIDLQRASSIGGSILFSEIYGIPCEEIFTYSDALKKVTSKDIEMLAKDIFAQNFVLCAAGSEQPW